MAGAPPLALRIDRRGVWQAGVAALVVLACATMISWWLAQPAPVPNWIAPVVVAACGGAAACGATLLRVGSGVALRWDGQQWWHACPEEEPVGGQLGVAIDLGDWMLLRFVPSGVRPWHAARWIPVQRGGLESAWQPLRCAVHAPRPHEAAPV